jgi:hypothetical protein
MTEPQQFSDCNSSQVSVKAMLWPTERRPVCLGIKPHLGHKSSFLLLSDSCGFVKVGRHLAGLSFTVAAGPRQSSHSRVRVARNSLPYFTLSHSRLSEPGLPGPNICDRQEHVDPVIFLATEFHFRLLHSQGCDGNIRTCLQTGTNWFQLVTVSG